MTAEGSGYIKIIVLGAGAIGSFYGSALSGKAGVLLVGRRIGLAHTTVMKHAKRMKNSLKLIGDLMN